MQGNQIDKISFEDVSTTRRIAFVLSLTEEEEPVVMRDKLG